MGNYTEENSSITGGGLNLEPVTAYSSSENDCVEKVDTQNEIEPYEEISYAENIISEKNCDLTNNDLSEKMICDNEKEINEEDELISRKVKNTRRLDSEPEDEGVEDSNKSNKENVIKPEKGKSNKEKVIKKSKKQIKQERLKIHSETNRLMREREISIPYHLPKQRTLKEFLARKKNRANIPLNAPMSKMVEIWKDIEESTKNASEFFKSDSESETETGNENVESENGNQEAKKTDDCESTVNPSINCIVKNDEISNNCNSINNDNSASIINTENVEKVTENECELMTESEKNLNSQELKLEDSVQSKDASIEKDVEESKNSEEVLENASELSSDEIYARERTSEWVKTIPVYEKLIKPNKKEILLQKLNPQLLNMTPKLSGEPDSFIELGTDENVMEVGVKNLRKRFLENCAPRKSVNKGVELTITSVSHDKGDVKNITTEKLIYNSTQSFKQLSLEKPGSKLQRLREELKKKIEEKWEEEHKRQNMEFVPLSKNKEIEQNDDEEDCEEELIEDVDDEESVSEEELDSEEEDEIHEIKRSHKKNEFIDDEAESDDEDEESEMQECKSNNEETQESEEEESRDVDDRSRNMENDSCDVSERSKVFSKGTYSDSQSSFIPPYQPGGGMLNGGSELTQCDGEPSLTEGILRQLSLDLSPAIKNSNDTVSQQTWEYDFNSPEESSNKNNLVPYFPETQNFDLDDAYEFCSGKFPDDGGGSLVCRTEESQEVSRDSQTTPANDVEGLTKSEEFKLSRVEVLSDNSDEDPAPEPEPDDDNDTNDITTQRILSEESDNEEDDKRDRKKRKQLVFSDDEEDEETKGVREDEDEETKGTREDEDDEEAEGMDDENEDIEENEEEENSSLNRNELAYDSEEEVINPGEFFEKEAELSGSEDWSGDEDERDLDSYEKEEGDADKLDEDKVRSDLERIHMRTLRDDDERQVRILQEILFEDGDLHDDGPKRERNFRWKDLGAFFDDDNNDDNALKCQDDDGEDDEQSAKIRHEKELFLLKLKTRREEIGLDVNEHGTSLLKLGKIVMERSKMKASRTKVLPKAGDVDESAINTPFSLTSQRGSFLSRNEEFLSRLAKFTANATDNILGPKHSKNFVFASKSPEKSNPSKENSHPKRKNSSPQTEKSKKSRTEPETGPKLSVLDFLT